MRNLSCFDLSRSRSSKSTSDSPSLSYLEGADGAFVAGVLTSLTSLTTSTSVRSTGWGVDSSGSVETPALSCRLSLAFFSDHFLSGGSKTRYRSSKLIAISNISFLRLSPSLYAAAPFTCAPGRSDRPVSRESGGAADDLSASAEAGNARNAEVSMARSWSIRSLSL